MSEKKELKEEDISKVSGGFDGHNFEYEGYCKDCKKNVIVYVIFDGAVWCSECGGDNVEAKH